MILAAGPAAAALVGVLVLAVGVAASRPDVAVLAAPALLTAVWSLATTPREQQVTARVSRQAQRNEAGEVGGVLQLDAPAGVEAALARFSAPGYRERHALLAAAPGREVTMSVDIARTGVHELFRVDLSAESPGALLVAPPEHAGPVRFAVHPLARKLSTLPLPWKLPGLTGAHTSHRVGDGFELHDVHPFAPGDRLRRIDWRVSARRGYDPRTQRLDTLYTRRTFATADAAVMVVIDSRDDVGPDVTAWAGGLDARMDVTTSLDLAREAAASISRAYLDAGDRVGLDDLGRRRRPIGPAGGRHHWERIMQRLVRVAPEGWPEARQRAPQFTANALVVLCSTFLDDEAARIARDWRMQGHRVIAVSTLPPLVTDFATPVQLTALRLVMLERRQRLRALRRTGVELVDWSGAAHAELHALTRTRSRAR